MLQQFLADNKETILAEWIEQIFKTYNQEMIRFLQKEKNQFANPVRNTIITSAEKIYDAIINNNEINLNYPGLEDLIKLRVVQDFSPSQALSFLFYLKAIVLAFLEKNEKLQSYNTEMLSFESTMDHLLALAFDIYSNCRSKIYEIRIAEIKSQSKRAFEILGSQKS